RRLPPDPRRLTILTIPSVAMLPPFEAPTRGGPSAVPLRTPRRRRLDRPRRAWCLRGSSLTPGSLLLGAAGRALRANATGSKFGRQRVGSISLSPWARPQRPEHRRDVAARDLERALAEQPPDEGDHLAPRPRDACAGAQLARTPHE